VTAPAGPGGSATGTAGPAAGTAAPVLAMLEHQILAATMFVLPHFSRVFELRKLLDELTQCASDRRWMLADRRKVCSRVCNSVTPY